MRRTPRRCVGRFVDRWTDAMTDMMDVVPIRNSAAHATAVAEGVSEELALGAGDGAAGVFVDAKTGAIGRDRSDPNSVWARKVMDWGPMLGIGP